MSNTQGFEHGVYDQAPRISDFLARWVHKKKVKTVGSLDFCNSKFRNVHCSILAWPPELFTFVSHFCVILFVIPAIISNTAPQLFAPCVV